MNKSKAGDLTQMAKDIVSVMELYFGEKPAVAIAFSLSTDEDVHWVTNVSRQDGLMLFNRTAKKMMGQN